MPTVTVTAIKAFEYGGRMVAPGDPVETEALKAAQLSRQGLVSLTRRYATRALQSEPVAAGTPTRRRRRYRRADITAEGE